MPPDRPSQARFAGLLTAAALLMSVILIISDGTYAPVFLAAMVVAYAVIAWVVVRVGPDLATLPEPDPDPAPAPWAEPPGSWSTGQVPLVTWIIPGGLILVTVAAVVAGSLGPVSAARVALASSAALGALSFMVPLPRRTTWALVTGLAAIAMVLAIQTHTPSDNDVWYTVQGGADAIIRGDDPYTQCWPGNPDPKTDCLYAYLPATSAVLVPFRLVAGDVRYGYIVAMAVASFAVFALGSARTGVALGALSMVIGAVLVDQAWTEPLILAAIAVMAWGARRGRLVPVIGLAVAFSLKQHIALLLPLGMAWSVIGPRWAIAAGVAAAMSALPWFIVDARAFLDDALWFHLGLAPRRDSLSLYAVLTVGGVTLPTAVGAALVAIGTVAAIGLAIVRLPRDAIGFVLGSAFVMFTFNLLNKQSFFNHHALVVGLLVIAIALETGRRRSPTRRQPVEVRSGMDVAAGA